MFSYTVKVRKVNGAKIKAIASLVIDEVLEIDGFKVINGINGLFVAVPSHKGEILEDGVKVEKYFDDIRFKGDDSAAVAQEIKSAILDAYNNGSYSSPSTPNKTADTSSVSAVAAASKAAAASAKASNNPSGTPAKKPLWGY